MDVFLGRTNILANELPDIFEKKENLSVGQPGLDINRIQYVLVETARENGSFKKENRDQLIKVVLERLYENMRSFPDNIQISDVLKRYNESYLDITPSDQGDNWKWTEGTYLNCDLRYLDLKLLQGNFDVVLLDPPWRIKGSEDTANGRTMFSNNAFHLGYNTLTKEEIFDVDVGCLSDTGLCFLWTINSQFPIINVEGLECLNRWGYTFVDTITWVKQGSDSSLGKGQGYYFLHSTALCLVGVKTHPTKKFRLHCPISSNVIVGGVKTKSKKPQELYEIIERMVPGARKIELFARNNNLRMGWLSLGNQLGEYYEWTVDSVKCNQCNEPITQDSKVELRKMWIYVLPVSKQVVLMLMITLFLRIRLMKRFFTSGLCAIFAM